MPIRDAMISCKYLPMTTKYWIKLYHEILDDPKMGRLSEVLFARCIKLFLLAGEYDRNGILPGLDDIAWRLRISTEELESDLIELQKIGILIRTPEGEWIVRKFADRQSPMEKAEYMRRKRSEKQSQQYYGDELPISYQPVTRSNVDTDTDIEDAAKNAASRASSESVSEKYKARTLKALEKYENRVKNGKADLSWLPEHVRPLAESFLDAAGESYYPTQKEQSIWHKACGEWYELRMQGVHIRKAVNAMRKDGLTIKNPFSITAIARSLMEQSKLGDEVFSEEYR